ncbi:MAG TPA: Gfo/Idh/MocA family oxidoreductase, partial [Rhodopila sp.]|nr:Gfo/Idh/MocA family oxidoreductase [Rhodopila sp.]
MTTIQASPKRVAIAGLGAIGLDLAQALAQGIPGYQLTAVSARDLAAAKERLSHLKTEIACVPLEELEAHADLVIECAPAKLLSNAIGPFLKAGKTAIVLSCGALLTNQDLIDLAKQHHGQIVVPSGALLGLDAVNAAAQGTIESVTMVTKKPVKGLLGAPYLEENNIDIANIT